MTNQDRWTMARDLLLSCQSEAGDTRTFNVKACRKFVERAADVLAEELDWAEQVMVSHTTYSRRRYGNGFYCYAEMDVVRPNGRAFSVDPWPASQYPRASLLAMLLLAKVSEPELAIGSAVSFVAA